MTSPETPRGPNKVRCPRDSQITKLLAKRSTLAANIYDKLRFRLIVPSREDMIPMLATLTRQLIPFNYVVPGESLNQLVDLGELARRAEARIRAIDAGVSGSFPIVRAPLNEFSGPEYRIVNFVADLPLRVERLLPRAEIPQTTVRAYPLGDRLTLRRRPLVVPEERGPDDVIRLVEKDRAVHLARETEADDVASDVGCNLGDRAPGSLPPVFRPLLGPSRPWAGRGVLDACLGANSALKLSRPAAVKTGTTNDFRDNWTIGYTPDLLVGVWVGNADNRPMREVSGVTGAAPLWRDVLEAADDSRPDRRRARTRSRRCSQSRSSSRCSSRRPPAPARRAPGCCSCR